MIRSFNFIREDVAEQAPDIFGDLDGIITGPVMIYPKDVKSLPKLMALAGVFRSSSEARRNGYEGEIPKGYTEKTTGNIRYYLYNPMYTEAEWRAKEIAEGRNPDE